MYFPYGRTFSRSLPRFSVCVKDLNNGNRSKTGIITVQPLAHYRHDPRREREGEDEAGEKEISHVTEAHTKDGKRDGSEHALYPAIRQSHPATADNESDKGSRKDRKC